MRSSPFRYTEFKCPFTTRAKNETVFFCPHNRSVNTRSYAATCPTRVCTPLSLDSWISESTSTRTHIYDMRDCYGDNHHALTD